MPPQQKKNGKLPSSSPLDETSTEPAKQDGIDASKINALVENLTSRLGGGLHGSFYEEGSPLDDKARHGQLQTMFELTKQLSELQTQTQKQASHPEGDGEVAGKAQGKPNTNMIKTIKSVVEQQLSDKLRDMTILNQRLEERLKKSEATIQSLEAKVQTFDKYIKQNKKVDASNQAVEAKMIALENGVRQNKKVEASVQPQIAALENLVKQNKKAEADNLELIRDLENVVKRNKHAFDRSQADIQERLDEVEEGLQDSEEYSSDEFDD